MNNFKINFKSKQYWAGLVIGILLCIIICKSRRSSYVPWSAIDIQKVTGSDQSIFNLPNQVGCVAGSQPTASPYTCGSPGGLCGAQKLVASKANYTITGGIGGSPLDAASMQKINSEIVSNQ